MYFGKFALFPKNALIFKASGKKSSQFINWFSLKFWVRKITLLLCCNWLVFPVTSWQKMHIALDRPKPLPHNFTVNLGLPHLYGARIALTQKPKIPFRNALWVWEYKYSGRMTNSCVCEFDGTLHKQAGYLVLHYFRLMLDCCYSLIRNFLNAPNRGVCYKINK